MIWRGRHKNGGKHIFDCQYCNKRIEAWYFIREAHCGCRPPYVFKPTEFYNFDDITNFDGKAVARQMNKALRDIKENYEYKYTTRTGVIHGQEVEIKHYDTHLTRRV